MPHWPICALKVATLGHLGALAPLSGPEHADILSSVCTGGEGCLVPTDPHLWGPQG